MSELDRDGDGYITREEYRRWSSGFLETAQPVRKSLLSPERAVQAECKDADGERAQKNAAVKIQSMLRKKAAMAQAAKLRAQREAAAMAQAAELRANVKIELQQEPFVVGQRVER